MKRAFIYATTQERAQASYEDRLNRQQREDDLAEEEAEKVVWWRGQSGKMISLHFEASKKRIYFKVDGQCQLFGYALSDFRRPTAAEKQSAPDVHAVLDNGEARMGLTKERCMMLKAKMEGK